MQLHNALKIASITDNMKRTGSYNRIREFMLKNQEAGNLHFISMYNCGISACTYPYVDEWTCPVIVTPCLDVLTSTTTYNGSNGKVSFAPHFSTGQFPYKAQILKNNQVIVTQTLNGNTPIQFPIGIGEIGNQSFQYKFVARGQSCGFNVPINTSLEALCSITLSLEDGIKYISTTEKYYTGDVIASNNTTGASDYWQIDTIANATVSINNGTFKVSPMEGYYTSYVGSTIPISIQYVEETGCTSTYEVDVLVKPLTLTATFIGADFTNNGLLAHYSIVEDSPVMENVVIMNVLGAIDGQIIMGVTATMIGNVLNLFYPNVSTGNQYQASINFGYANEGMVAKNLSLSNNII